jgi:hypothetical protein
MAEKRSFGLKSIKIGDIAVDGGMGTVLAALAVTSQGTANFAKAEDEVKEFFCEESDDPIELVTKKGRTTLEFSINDVTPATLEKVLGGTVDVSVPASPVWEAPDSAPDLEKSIEVISKKDVKIEIPRARINASIDWKLGTDALATVKIKATVLTPTKDGEPSVKIS